MSGGNLNSSVECQLSSITGSAHTYTGAMLGILGNPERKREYELLLAMLENATQWFCFPSASVKCDFMMSVVA